ncbi:hypothetical protein VCHA53O466_40339 [Vibrio chagasii]|nr:hypothetical protein VCHA53O466_40339 [Vibrio chagasii]
MTTKITSSARLYIISLYEQISLGLRQKMVPLDRHSMLTFEDLKGAKTVDPDSVFGVKGRVDLHASSNTSLAKTLDSLTVNSRWRIFSNVDGLSETYRSASLIKTIKDNFDVPTIESIEDILLKQHKEDALLIPSFSKLGHPIDKGKIASMALNLKKYVILDTCDEICTQSELDSIMNNFTIIVSNISLATSSQPLYEISTPKHLISKEGIAQCLGKLAAIHKCALRSNELKFLITEQRGLCRLLHNRLAECEGVSVLGESNTNSTTVSFTATAAIVTEVYESLLSQGVQVLIEDSYGSLIMKCRVPLGCSRQLINRAIKLIDRSTSIS